MIRRLIVIISLLISCDVFAEFKNEWYPITKTDDGTLEYSLNPSKMEIIDVDNQIVESWTKSIVLKKYNGVSGKIYNKGDITYIKNQFDCKNHTYRISTSALYQGDKPAVTFKHEEKEWVDVIPDTTMDDMFGLICSPKVLKSIS